MGTVGEAFLNHHRALAEELAHRAAAVIDGRPEADPEGLAVFPKAELLSHAAGEEQHLYPAVEPLLKAHGMATATMRVDHRFLEDYVRRIEEAAARLRLASPDERRRLQVELSRLALQLEAVFQVHLEKEERVYLPLFEQYVPEGVQRQVLERMHEPHGADDGTTDGFALDVRRVPPARRHPMILDRFERLAPGQAFVLVNDHDPKPLYYQFRAERTGQFTWEYLETGPEVWRVRIGKTA